MCRPLGRGERDHLPPIYSHGEEGQNQSDISGDAGGQVFMFEMNGFF